jgi:uncharacterized alpha-E superfamily protein
MTLECDKQTSGAVEQLVEVVLHRTICQSSMVTVFLLHVAFEGIMKNHCAHQVRRGSILYRACSMTVIMPSTVNGKMMTVVTDHLVHLVLTWALCAGCYEPEHDFKEQEHRVFDFVLQHPIPDVMMYPIQRVRANLGHILYLRKEKNCTRMRQQRNGTYTGKRNVEYQIGR